MMERVLPPNPDLETKEEAHSTWHIQDWRKLERKLHGPIFKCGGFPWWVIILAEACRRERAGSDERRRRILFFPYGNNSEHVSFYLEHAWEDQPPENWYACVQFALVLSNVKDPSIYVSHGK